MIQNELAKKLDVLLTKLSEKCYSLGLGNFTFDKFIENFQAQVFINFRYEPATNDYYFIQIESQYLPDGIYYVNNNNINSIESTPLLILTQAFAEHGLLEDILGAIYETAEDMKKLLKELEANMREEEPYGETEQSER